MSLKLKFFSIRNIFLKQNGDIKLGDFGISRLFEETTSIINTFAGTHQYMSPEMRIPFADYTYNTDCW